MDTIQSVDARQTAVSQLVQEAKEVIEFEDNPHRAALENNSEYSGVDFATLASIGHSAPAFVITASVAQQITINLGDPYAVTWMVSAWSLASAVSSSLAGPLSDIFRRRWPTLIGEALTIVGCIMAAVTENVPTLIAGEAVVVVSTGLLFVAYKEGLLYHAVILGNALYYHATWRWIFYIAIIGEAIALVVERISWILTPPTKPRAKMTDPKAYLLSIMRLEYLENPPPNLSPKEQQVVENIKEVRGKLGLLQVDLTLLHAPEFAAGWHSMFGAIRRKSSLPDDIREIAICRTGLINKAWYEWGIHSQILLETKNFNEEKLAVVKQAHPTSQGPLNDRQWVILRYADVMTREVAVPQALFDEVKAVGLTTRQVVELTATISGYNMVSRFLVALDVAEANDKAPSWAMEFERERDAKL